MPSYGLPTEFHAVASVALSGEGHLDEQDVKIYLFLLSTFKYAVWSLLKADNGLGEANNLFWPAGSQALDLGSKPPTLSPPPKFY